MTTLARPWTQEDADKAAFWEKYSAQNPRTFDNAYTAAPTGTTKAYQIGDFIRKSNPVEAGGGGSKYIIVGWICSVAGSPGTWHECRFLTGN